MLSDSTDMRLDSSLVRGIASDEELMETTIFASRKQASCQDAS